MRVWNRVTGGNLEKSEKGGFEHPVFGGRIRADILSAAEGSGTCLLYTSIRGAG